MIWQIYIGKGAALLHYIIVSIQRIRNIWNSWKTRSSRSWWFILHNKYNNEISQTLSKHDRAFSAFKIKKAMYEHLVEIRRLLVPTHKQITSKYLCIYFHQWMTHRSLSMYTYPFVYIIVHLLNSALTVMRSYSNQFENLRTKGLWTTHLQRNPY